MRRLADLLPSIKAAADKVDNFKLVSASDWGRGPCGARHDLAIVLDGDAVGFEFQGGDEAVQRRR